MRPTQNLAVVLPNLKVRFHSNSDDTENTENEISKSILKDTNRDNNRDGNRSKNSSTRSLNRVSSSKSSLKSSISTARSNYSREVVNEDPRHKLKRLVTHCNSTMVVNGCICILICLVIASALSVIVTVRCFQDKEDLKVQNENLTQIIDKLRTENDYLRSMLDQYRSKRDRNESYTIL